MKKILFVVFALLAVYFSSVTAYALDGGSSQRISEQLDIMDMGDINRVIGSSEYTKDNSLNFRSLIMNVIQGNPGLSVNDIIRYLLNGLFGEINAIVSLMKNMVLIAIIGAVFKNLSSSFRQKGAAEIGFYVTYIVITMLLMSSFGICLGVAQGLISELCSLMEAAVPTMISLMFMTGSVTGAYLLNPILLFITNFLGSFVRDFMLTAIIAAAGLELVNHISDKDILTKLTELIKKGLSWGMKSIAVLFITVLSIQSISAPLLNNGVTKSAKALINVVPVVGQALSGAVDTIGAWAGVVKGGTLVAMIIVIIFFCAAPLIKLLAFIVILKLTAGLIQPISESRIVKAIDCVGTYVSLLLGACVLVVVVFVFAAMITLSL